MTTTTPPTAEDARKAIEAAGWEPEVQWIGPLTSEGGSVYRAKQGGFSTPWLDSWSEVLNYIQAKGGK